MPIGQSVAWVPQLRLALPRCVKLTMDANYGRWKD